MKTLKLIYIVLLTIFITTGCNDEMKEVEKDVSVTESQEFSEFIGEWRATKIEMPGYYEGDVDGYCSNSYLPLHRSLPEFDIYAEDGKLMYVNRKICIESDGDYIAELDVLNNMRDINFYVLSSSDRILHKCEIQSISTNELVIKIVDYTPTPTITYNK